jgi:hypothetical protein
MQNCLIGIPIRVQIFQTVYLRLVDHGGTGWVGSKHDAKTLTVKICTMPEKMF